LDLFNDFVLEWPNFPTEGRNLKPEELRELLDALSDYSIDYFINEESWQADIRANKGVPLFRPNSLLNVIDYNGDETCPHLVCLESGDIKLNFMIAERLSKICGPLFLIPDTGTLPLIVQPGSDPDDLMKQWRTR
jgi:hypothetical protein